MSCDYNRSTRLAAEPVYSGNCDFLKLPKTAFLASRCIAPEAVLRCYDWAIEQRKDGRCVISGFHSALEKDVLQLLLKGVQPVILVLARQLYSTHTLPRLYPELHKALAEGRLLMVSVSTTVRASRATTFQRNQYIIKQAEHIVLGSLNPDGGLAKLVASLPEDRITRLFNTNKEN